MADRQQVMSNEPRLPSDGEAAWLRHYEDAARRRRAGKPRRWWRTVSRRMRHQRVLMTTILVGLCAICALLGVALL